MKFHALRLLLLPLLLSTKMALAQTAPAHLLNTLKAGHPRLIASAESWGELRRLRKEDAQLDGFLKQSEQDARSVLTGPPVVYEKTGRRLLSVSRRVLRDVLLLSLTYRITGDAAFARKAEEEMLTVSAFPDWNPSHFLDVAEMSAAVGFGYDWLFDALSPETRATLRTALVEKGLRPGLDEGSPYRGWQNTTNNWNSVCYGGLTVAALAIAEDEPKWAETVVELARAKNPAGMKAYAPEGVFPEGPMYWGYGTGFEVILLATLESALGTDFGLSQSPGFLNSASAYLQMTGATGKAFNFSDGVENLGIEASLFWFAKKNGQPELLRTVYPKLRSYDGGKAGGEGGRLLPLIALWWPRRPEQYAEMPKFWLGRGGNPIAVFRSAWDNPNAMYLGVKAGTPSASHGHMDVGSFVFESDGVRWARDLGMQDYNSLESKGVGLWDAKQEGGRWKIFRLGPFSHNTLTVDGQLHQVSAKAVISKFSDAGGIGMAQVDLVASLGGVVTKAARGFVFRPGEHVYVVDELEGLKPESTVRWAMATGAEITLDGTKAVLRQNGKELDATLTAPAGVSFAVESADYTGDGFDAPNPGVQMLVAKMKAPGDGKLRIGVMLRPGSAKETGEPLADKALADW